jgi:hypothetical protein
MDLELVATLCVGVAFYPKFRSYHNPSEYRRDLSLNPEEIARQNDVRRDKTTLFIPGRLYPSNRTYIIVFYAPPEDRAAAWLRRALPSTAFANQPVHKQEDWHGV